MTEFEKSVLRIVATIPLGEVRSYKWVAQQLGKPKAARAVANALGKNPYTLFIPCHRVIHSDGSIGGYSLGRSLKQQLLNFERKISNALSNKDRYPQRKNSKNPQFFEK